MDPVSSLTSVAGQTQVLLLARMMDAQRAAGASVVAMLAPAPAVQAAGTPKVAGTGTDLYL